MMHLPHFSSLVDVPLAISIYVLSVFGTVIWLRRAKPANDRLTKVTEVRVATRILIVLLSILVPCYLIDFAFWGAATFVVALLIFGSFVGGEPGGVIAGPVVIAALFVREYVLGFPDLILHPEAAHETAPQEVLIDPLVGQQAITVSVLRPFGSIEFEGRVLQAVSDTGDFVDSNTTVFIRSSRNGVYSVEVISGIAGESLSNLK
jgi:membrane-bound ClpP family serine protease